MKNKTFKITFQSLWYLFTSTALAVICVGGYNPYFMNTRTMLSAGLVLCSLFVALIIRKKIIIDTSLGLFIIVGAYMLFSAPMSMDTDTSFKIAGYYIVGIAVLMIEYSDEMIDTVLKFMNVFVLVIAVSIIISVPIDDCMNKYFSWLLNPTHNEAVAQSMRNAIVHSRSYAGFARDKSVAAYIMGMGICIYLAKYFSGKKLKWYEVVGLLAEISALLLTSKRMILVCLVAVFAVLMLTSQIKGKIVKFAVIVLAAASALFIIMSFIPSMSNVFSRFTNEENNTLTGRSDLWSFSFMMFSKSPVIGVGLGSFNEFAAQQGYLSASGDRWDYFGHNCYYEFGRAWHCRFNNSFRSFALYARKNIYACKQQNSAPDSALPHLFCSCGRNYAAYVQYVGQCFVICRPDACTVLCICNCQEHYRKQRITEKNKT